MRRRRFVLSSAGIAATISGCAGGDDGGGDGDAGNADLPQEATVSVADEEFDPRIVRVGAGGSVTWENDSEESVRINAFQFHTGSEGWSFRETLEPGASTSHTFEAEGRYDFMEPNRGQFAMCGRVRVGSVDEGESLPCE